MLHHVQKKVKRSTALNFFSPETYYLRIAGTQNPQPLQLCSVLDKKSTKPWQQG